MRNIIFSQRQLPRAIARQYNDQTKKDKKTSKTFNRCTKIVASRNRRITRVTMLVIGHRS